MFDRVSFSRGLHLRGTPLWFDAQAKRATCVVTSLGGRLPPRHNRLVASPDVVHALQGAGYPARSLLPATWDRWIGLGGQKLKLLPAGDRTGGAQALVTSGSERIVLAGLVRQAPTRWPSAELFVGIVPTLGHRGAALEQVMRGLSLFVEQARADKVRAAVWVDSLEVGIELGHRLGEMGRPARPLGSLAKVAIASDRRRSGLSIGLVNSRVPPSARIAFVDTGLGRWGAGRPKARGLAATFRLRWFADWSALKHSVSMSRAERVVLVGGPGPSVSRKTLSARFGGREVVCLGMAQQLELTTS